MQDRHFGLIVQAQPDAPGSVAKNAAEVETRLLFATQAFYRHIQYGKDVATLQWHCTTCHPCHHLAPGALRARRAFWLRPHLRPLAPGAKYAAELKIRLLSATQA